MMFKVIRISLISPMGHQAIFTINRIPIVQQMSKVGAGIKVYPNPTNGQMTIELNESMVGNAYNLIDHQGKIVKIGVLNDTKTTIQPKLKNGMYYLMIGGKVIKVEVIE